MYFVKYAVQSIPFFAPDALEVPHICGILDSRVDWRPPKHVSNSEITLELLDELNLIRGENYTAAVLSI